MSPAERIRRAAPWLCAEELGLCIVGSTALAEACRRAGIAGPSCADLDLAWMPDIETGAELLQRRGVLVATTAASRERGTLALALDGERIEITSFRGAGAGAGVDERIRADLHARDMTVGAIAWQVSSDRLIDPLHGLVHWRERRVVPVGDPAARVAEHPVRWLRYYRKAHEWGFDLAGSVRRLRPDAHLLARIPPEAVAAEIVAALLTLDSPGRFLLELHEARGLAHLAPELAPQFDGRPAGPVRHHPEVGQALHVILALEWASARTRALPRSDRLAVMLAVLCHDLGKGATPDDNLPSHHGHEHGGLPLIRSLFERLPGLGDAAARRLSEQVAMLHLTVRRLRDLRPATAARLYEDCFRPASFPLELFALAVGADVGGRLGLERDGEELRRRVVEDVSWLRERCETVDAAELRRRYADTEAFRDALHEARARAIRAG